MVMRVSEAAFKAKPDLVVMDIGLPRLDGIAATQRIKAAARHSCGGADISHD